MIFEFIRSLLSFDLLVELSENKITMQKFSTGQFIEIEPWISLEGGKGKEKNRRKPQLSSGAERASTVDCVSSSRSSAPLGHGAREPDERLRRSPCASGVPHARLASILGKKRSHISARDP